MKVLLVSPYYPPFAGVGALRAYSLSRFLITQGDQVTVVQLAHTLYQEKTTMAAPDGVETIEVSAQDTAYRHLKRAFEKALDALLSRQRFDVALVTCGPFYTLDVMVKMWKQYGLPYIIDYRDLWTATMPRNPVRRWLSKQVKSRIEKRAIGGAKKIITVSEQEKAILQKLYHLEEEKTAVIYNGYDDAILHAHPGDSVQGEYNIGCLGKFGYYSTAYMRWVLEALQALRPQFPTARVYHIGEREPAVTQWIESQGLDPSIYHYAGYQEYAQGVACMQQMRANVLIYTSTSGLGTKIFDYIFADRPILLLAPKASTLAKLVGSFAHGMVCESREETFEAIEKVLSQEIAGLDPELRKEQFSRSRQNAVFRKCLMQAAQS